MGTIIKLENISKHFDGRCLFNDLDLSVKEGEFIGIRGKSGAGKTTLLNIMGLLEPCEGRIFIKRREVTYKDKKLVRCLLKNEIGYLFQNFALIDDRTVYDNLQFVLGKMKRSEKRERIESALQAVGLAGVVDKKVYQLSGGEQQRVSIARIILKDCSIILGDEPTGSLDPENAILVLDLLKKMNEQGKTVIIVSHSDEIISQCGRIIDLS